MHDPEKDHWEAVKWVLRYIKGTLNVGLVFRNDSMGKQECIGYVDSDYAGDLTNAGPQRGMHLHYLKHRSVGALFYSLSSHCLLQKPSTWP